MVVIGGANTDFVVKGPKLPQPGETVDGHDFLQAFGGKGANQAVACSRLGARVAFIGCVGDDKRGAETIRNFRRERVDVSHVRQKRGSATGVALVMVDSTGEKQILTAPGANQRLTVADIERAAPLLRSTKVLLMQYEVPEAAVIKAAEIARKAGAIVVVDPAPARRTSMRLLRLIDVVRPNNAEAKVLTGLKIQNVATARRAAKKLFAAGVKMVALQIGDAGDLILWPGGRAFLGGRASPRAETPSVGPSSGGRAACPADSQRETQNTTLPDLMAPMELQNSPIFPNRLWSPRATQEHFLPRLKVNTVDATGAGDAFAAGLAVALAEGRNYAEAGILANAAAALTTTKLGAQPALPRRREVLALLKRDAKTSVQSPGFSRRSIRVSRSAHAIQSI